MNCGEIIAVDTQHSSMVDVINDLQDRVLKLEEENKQLREALIEYGLLIHEEDSGV